MTETTGYFGAWGNSRYSRRTLHELSKRAEVAATFIAPNSSVLDLGCGHRLIVPHLPVGCRYYGIDKNPVFDDVPVMDLDAHEFPEGDWDSVLMLGLLAWVKDPLWVLTRASKTCRRLVIAIHRTKDYGTEEQLAATGWRVLDCRNVWDNPDRKVDIALCDHSSII